MNILILNTFPAWGGDEKWTINVGKGLQKRGHQVVISSPPGSETEKRALKSNLKIFSFHIGPDIAFWKIPPFKKYLKTQEIDVLLCVQNRDVKIGGLAARLAGTPVIFARQGLDTMKRLFFHKIAFTKFVDGIITNTNSIKKLYESYNWFSKDFIHVIYDGLVLPDKLSKIDLHKEFDLIPGSKVIIGTGRLAEQKRFDLLIKVGALAKKQDLNWSIIIAGTGRMEKELQRMAVESGVEDIIKFIGFRDDVLTLMHSADLFVLSSDSEGMSNALREAMAVGKACVATDVYGVEELFQNNAAGLMVKKGDHELLFDGIKKVLSNENIKKTLEKNARKRIKEDFTVELMIENLENLFQEYLNKKLK